MATATTNSLLKQEVALDQLPKELFWDSTLLYQYEGFWYPGEILKGMLANQSQFEARFDDVILASSMKTGTTWLKALAFYIMGYRSCKNGDNKDELLDKNPHEQVRSLEFIYEYNEPFDPSCVPSPRVFHTHLPFSALSDTIKNSECKIVYIARNPKDTLVSLFHYLNKNLRPNQEPYPLEKAYEAFSKGVHPFGPHLDHVLEYWLESLKMPQKILFLKYEDLKRDTRGQVKRLAQFVGRPFTSEEEVDMVVWKSSLERLKNLNINKNGTLFYSKEMRSFSSFFRRGEVGDWKNHLTAEMEQALDQITRTKLENSGLDFETKL